MLKLAYSHALDGWQQLISFHSDQLFLVSNGGKFVKKTLIGEAYVWLDKVDLRKRVVSWHKLLASTAQIHS